MEAKSPASAPRLQPHVTGHQFDTFGFLVAGTSIHTLAPKLVNRLKQLWIFFQKLVLLVDGVLYILIC